MKCYICKKEFNEIGYASHVNKDIKIFDIKLNKKEIKYNQICFNYKIFTKEEIENLYQNNSINNIAKIFNTKYQYIEFLLDYFQIPKRNIQEANKHISRQNETIKTCKEKYGENITNVSQLENVKEKKKKTFLDKYGVDNIWKSKEYTKWLEQFMLNKYGKKSLPNRYGNKTKWWRQFDKEERTSLTKNWVDGYKKYWSELTDDEKKKINDKRSKSLKEFYENLDAEEYYKRFFNKDFTYLSNLENRIAKILDQLKINYIRQYWIGQKNYDFKLQNSNIIIEVNGDYWHANPEKYKKDDIIKYPQKTVIAEEIWNKDLKKKETAHNKGYKIIYLWEKEINQFKEDINLQQFLLNKI